MIEVDPTLAEDQKELTEYEVTSRVLLDMMNSIESDLKFTIENQTQYKDNSLPIPDFVLTLRHTPDTHIQYSFYKKPHMEYNMHLYIFTENCNTHMYL